MNNSLERYTPEYTDLWFKQLMLSDEETMAYNHAWGGTISFPEERWAGWFDRWIVNHDDKRYYRYLLDQDENFVGEIAYHYDDEMDVYLADVLIYAKFRKMGYGGIGLELLCTAAKENGIKVLYDNIAIDNPAIALFLKQGFTEESRTKEYVILKKEL